MITDSFLWPLNCRDVPKIKQLAISLLADVFGKSFEHLDQRESEFFCIHIVYLIQREIELCLHPDNNFRALAMDGVVGPGMGRITEDGIEHVFMVQIDITLQEDETTLQIKDAFEWDLSNPDNSPDDIAGLIVADLLVGG